MSEWNEQKLNEELEALTEELPLPDDLEKKIIAGINQRIRKVAAKTFFGILSAILIAILIISPLMNAMTGNYIKMNQEPDKILTHVFRDYFELTKPFREVYDVEVKAKGFGRYKLDLQVFNRLSKQQTNHTVSLETFCGKYMDYEDPGLNLTHYMGIFGDDFMTSEERIRQFSELPASAQLCLSVSDSNVRSLEELRNEAIQLVWLQVYQPNVRFQCGIALQRFAACDETDYREQMTEQELLEIYLSNMENLLEHPLIWTYFGLNDGHFIIPEQPSAALKETYEDAKNLTELTTKYYCISGQRDEVVAFLQNNDIRDIHIDDISLW